MSGVRASHDPPFSNTPSHRSRLSEWQFSQASQCAAAVGFAYAFACDSWRHFYRDVKVLADAFVLYQVLELLGGNREKDREIAIGGAASHHVVWFKTSSQYDLPTFPQRRTKSINPDWTSFRALVFCHLIGTLVVKSGVWNFEIRDAAMALAPL